MVQLHDPTDAEAISQVLAGDQAQYQTLVERYYRTVYNASYRLLGHSAEVADMTQETFLRAYKALHTFRLDAPLAPWLCHIATNLSLNQLKRRCPTLFRLMTTTRGKLWLRWMCRMNRNKSS